MRTLPPQPKNKKIKCTPCTQQGYAEHDFKTQLSPTRGHEAVLVPRELGPWLQRSEHL